VKGHKIYDSQLGSYLCVQPPYRMSALCGGCQL
jgi:hypothetical protein